MKNTNLFQKFCPLLFSVIFLICAYFVNVNNEKPLMFISKQDQSINFDSSFYTYFNLGLKRFISSSLWISTIIESDVEHYKQKDLNSWMFLRFNSISILEPMFYENYTFGGIYLSIIKDDIPGASIIYNKGLALFPNDFVLLRDAAFHFHFEANDFERSYQLHSKLINHPNASAIIISSFARLEKERGNTDAAFNILASKLAQLKDQNSFLALKIKNHLYALKAEKDLNCLNKKIPQNTPCSLRDYENNFYLRKDGVYYALKDWIPFAIKKKAPR